MKKLKRLKNPINVGGVSVSITTNDLDEREYKSFPLKNPEPYTSLIGTEDGDKFQIALSANFSERYAIAVYVDGVNVYTKGGTKKLSDIKNPESYYSHEKFICGSDYNNQINRLDRYLQDNGENRFFTFSSDVKDGVNYNTINEVESTSKIKVFFWKENKRVFSKYGRRGGTTIDMLNVSYKDTRSYKSKSSKKSVVGAGEASNKDFGSTSTLEKPQYLGVATFVHVNQEHLSHLMDQDGRFIKIEKSVDDVNINTNPAEFISQNTDPMDSVPKS